MAEELPRVPEPQESVDAGQAHPGDQAHAKVGHERSDVNVRGVLVFGFGVAAALALVGLLVARLRPLLGLRGSAEKASDLPPEFRGQAGPPGDPATREPRLEGIDPQRGQFTGPAKDWPNVPLRSGVPGWESNAQELLRRDRA